MHIAVSPHLRASIRQFTVMAVILGIFGIGPVLALKAVPANPGAVQRKTLTGKEAHDFYMNHLAQNGARLAAYKRAEATLLAKGKKRTSVAISMKESVPAPQSALRRIAELVVPTLYAARDQYEFTVFDDWSGYDPSFVGTHYSYSYWTQTEVMMSVEFAKDPEDEVAETYADLEYCYGSCPSDERPEASSTVGRVLKSIHEAAFPTVTAAELPFKTWRDRVKGWWVCSVSGCSATAASCFIANVVTAEVGWAPCFAVGCGGTEVGCAVYEILTW